jgi:hypothetical protein
MESPSFSMEEVLVVLRNVGVDVECGACVEVAMTGASMGTHACDRSLPSVSAVLMEDGEMPTEPGSYVFVGYRRIPSDMGTPTDIHPELVRVIERNDGSLLRVGLDVFWEHEAPPVGEWARVDLSNLRRKAYEKMRAKMLREEHERFRQDAWRPAKTAAGFRRHLELMTFGGPFRDQLDEAVEVAVAMGLPFDDDATVED